MSEKTPVLLADIGGTHARFGLALPAGQNIYATTVLRCADYETLAHAVEAYLAGQSGPRPQFGVMAVATPVEQDRIKLTNHIWSFSIAATRRQLGLTSLQLINDFTALALALPYLATNQLCQIGGPAIEPAAPAPLALVGPGTGLGVSGLIPSACGWLPLAGEGGHVTYGGVNERENEIVAVLAKRFGHVSAERLLSGPGLVNIYEALSGLAGKRETLASDEISAKGAADTCPLCSETLAIFCAALGTVSGNLALTLGATGGVYIGGGIAPKILPFLRRSQFRARFEQHGRLQPYLCDIPCYVITAEQPALLGSLQVAKGGFEQLGVTSSR